MPENSFFILKLLININLCVKLFALKASRILFTTFKKTKLASFLISYFVFLLIFGIINRNFITIVKKCLKVLAVVNHCDKICEYNFLLKNDTMCGRFLNEPFYLFFEKQLIPRFLFDVDLNSSSEM